MESVNRFESAALESVNRPECTVLESAGRPESAVLKPINDPENTALEPISHPASATSTPIHHLKSTPSAPINDPSSTALKLIYHPSGTALEARLGTGAHASVYALRELATQRLSAFKLYHKSTPQVLRGAQRERKFLQHMSAHPLMRRFVPEFYSFSTKPLFLRMQLVHGAQLDVAALSERAFTRVLDQAELFINYLHAHFSLSLRDVSPRNILLSTSGDVKFVDFEQISEIGKLYELENAGTPRYAAPSDFCGPYDDLLALAFIFLERDAQLPWRCLRDVELIREAKKACLADCRKYFGYIQNSRLRSWIFAFAGAVDDGYTSEYVDYCAEFAQSGALCVEQ